MAEAIKWIETEGSGHWFFYAYPAALLFLFIWLKGRRASFLIPSLLITVVIINPFFVRKWNELGLYAYWRILWIIPVLAAVVPGITEKIALIREEEGEEQTGSLSWKGCGDDIGDFGSLFGRNISIQRRWRGVC